MAPSRHEKMVNAAVWLAQQGAFIGWGPTADGKAVVRHWKDDMTADPALVPGLLGGAKNALIVPAGRLVVIDVDKAGWYERLLAAGLPETFTLVSPSVRRADTSKPVAADYVGETFRGHHVYVFAPAGYPVTDIPSTWAGGETRRSEHGDQNMVLGPWAMRKDGVYEPLPGSPRVIAEAPLSVFDFLLAHQGKKTNGAAGPLITVADPDWVWDEATMGSRHDHLRDLIRGWRGHDADPDSLKKRTVEYIKRHAIPLDRGAGEQPIDDKEIDRMVAGALKFGDDKPESTAITAEVPSATPGEAPEVIVIDPLLIETRIERPEPMDSHAMYLPVGLAMLLDHYQPLTDAPDSSLLLASAVTFSALVGNVPTLRWRGKHRSALFGALVGHSGFGRKGATLRVVEKAFMQVDPVLDDITKGGMASGEVFIDVLNESKKNLLGTVLLREHELSGVLIVASREGSILSGILRRAWDGDKVETRSRMKGVSEAYGYNAAFLGGITPGELAKHLTANDIANGWANRFLWFHSERREGGFDSRASEVLDTGVADYLRDCIQFARTLRGSMLIPPEYTMELSDKAHDRMEALALSLDVAPVGTIGALRQRMPAHVTRLAMVAALLDQSRVVDASHVAFGEAMTAYAVESMRAVFGVRVDDDVAMYILSLLAQVPDGWMNTTDLKKATGKEYSRVQSALRVLLGENLIVVEARPTGGRPALGYRLRTRL